VFIFVLFCFFFFFLIFEKNSKYFSIGYGVIIFFLGSRFFHSFNFQGIGFMSDFHRFCKRDLAYIYIYLVRGL
jgi:hypothetical protein